MELMLTKDEKKLMLESELSGDITTLYKYFKANKLLEEIGMENRTEEFIKRGEYLLENITFDYGNEFLYKLKNISYGDDKEIEIEFHYFYPMGDEYEYNATERNKFLDYILEFYITIWKCDENHDYDEPMAGTNINIAFDSKFDQAIFESFITSPKYITNSFMKETILKIAKDLNIPESIYISIMTNDEGTGYDSLEKVINEIESNDEPLPLGYGNWF